MTLSERIATEMREAMKARDQLRTSTLRLLMAAIKNTQVERGHPLDDDEVLEVIAKEAKRRRESIEAYRDAGRADLADKESAEHDILAGYLPAQLGEDELGALVDEAIAASGATGAKDMGAVMKVLMPKVKGRADGSVVSAAVRARLT